MKKYMILLWVYASAFAQEFRPNPIVVADFAQKSHSRNESAQAAVIYKVGDCNISFDQHNGFQTRYVIKTRIKIYTKEGYGHAMQSVVYRSGSTTQVYFDDAFTYNLEDGKIVKTPLKKDGIFDEAVTKYVSRKKIQFPNVKVGSILEFTCTVAASGVMTPPQWSFQSQIPVDFSQYSVHIPEYLIYNTNQKGSLFPKVAKRQQERSGGYAETITTYTAENMPALLDEGYVVNIENYTSGVAHELAAVRLPMRYSVYSEKVASDWTTIAKRMYTYDDFGGELKKKGYFEKQIDSLAAGLQSRDEIIRAVFDFCKSQVKWNKRYGLFCENGVKSAFRQRMGNVADINLMLTAMLRHLEIEASPVLVSTRDNGIVLFPSISNFDYVIVGVQTPTGFILLDATEEFSVPDILPLRDLNWFGRLIRENGTSEQIDLIPSGMSKKLTFVNAQLQPDGKISGKIKNTYTKYEALEFRERSRGVGRETFIEGLETRYGNIQIGDYARDNEADVNQALAERFDFTDDKAVETIGGKLYFSPMLFLSMKENPFRQEKREYPVDFGYPTQSRLNATIRIPDGYQVESMPESLSLDTESGSGSFKFALALQNDAIQLTVTAETKTSLVAADDYTMLKAFYQQIVDKQNEKIILKKRS